MGGLARRASVFSRLRDDATIPVLTLVGADEFVVDAYVEPDPAKTGNATPDTVRRAYDALNVDAGYLSQKATAWFGATLPRRFQPVATKPVVRRVHVGGVSVAMVFFPPEVFDETSDADPESQPNALLPGVLVAARSVSDATIRIGISPWGFQRERQALRTLAQEFDVLLGGGPGAPFVAEVDVAAPSLLWSRADFDGKSVMVLDLLDIPAPGAPRDWTPGLFSRCREEVLTSHVPAAARMEQVLSGRTEKGEGRE